MQDVVYLDEGMEEVTKLYPIDTNGMLSMSPHSPLARKSLLPVPQEQEEQDQDKNTSEDEAPPSISVSEDEHAK